MFNISQFQLRPSPPPGQCGAFVTLTCPHGRAFAAAFSPGAQNKESNQKGHSLDVRRSRRHRPAYTRERAAAMFLGSIVYYQPRPQGLPRGGARAEEDPGKIR
jgi:hypothetical protein